MDLNVDVFETVSVVEAFTPDLPLMMNAEFGL